MEIVKGLSINLVVKVFGCGIQINDVHHAFRVHCVSLHGCTVGRLAAARRSHDNLCVSHLDCTVHKKINKSTVWNFARDNYYFCIP